MQGDKAREIAKCIDDLIQHSLTERNQHNGGDYEKEIKARDSRIADRNDLAYLLEINTP